MNCIFMDTDGECTVLNLENIPDHKCWGDGCPPLGINCRYIGITIGQTSRKAVCTRNDHGHPKDTFLCNTCQIREGIW